MEEDSIISETESFIIWTSDEDEGKAFHIELGGITLHLNTEEWEELVTLIKAAD